MIHKPVKNEEGYDAFEIDGIESDSFASELTGTDDHECSKEVQSLLVKTKEMWPALTSPESQKLTQALTSEPTEAISQNSDQEE